MPRHKAVLRVLIDKRNLAIAGGVATASVFFGLWVIGLGVAVLALLASWDIARGRHIGKPEAPRIPDASGFRHALIRSALESIGEAQRERVEIAEACPIALRAMLQGTLRSAAAVEKTAVRLARRADKLHRYLTQKDVGLVRAALAAAQQAALSARSEIERESYEAAARAYEEEAATLASIDVGVRATVARLENIRATLASVPPRIVKLDAATADIGDPVVACLPGDLRGATSELAELEEAEDHLAALSLASEDDCGVAAGALRA